MIQSIKDLRHAGNLIGNVSLGRGILPLGGKPYPLSEAMTAYVLDFEAAERKKRLHSFGVQDQLRQVRAVAANMFSGWRSTAGLLVLLGLLASLANLQRAIGPLGAAFRQLANDPSSSSQASIGQIQLTMSSVAASAQTAFRYSAGCIFGAFACICVALFGQWRVRKTFAKFERWATTTYRERLPEEISIAEAAISLKANADGLGEMVRALGDLAFSFNAIKDFSGTMHEVREAIVRALEAMPGQIQASMGLVSRDMVKSLEISMREDVEAIKKILAIYGQQEFRIDEIHKHVEAIETFSEKITGSAALLEGIPLQLSAIEASVQQHSAIGEDLSQTVQRVEDAIQKLPADALNQSAQALLKASSSIGQAHAEVTESIANLQRKLASLTELDQGFSTKVDRITTASQELVGAYDGLMLKSDSSQAALESGLNRLSTQISREIVSLSSNAELAALRSELTRVHAALAHMSAEIRPRLRAGISDHERVETNVDVWDGNADREQYLQAPGVGKPPAGGNA